jgi:iron complex transport system substrate-binding protein
MRRHPMLRSISPLCLAVLTLLPMASCDRPEPARAPSERRFIAHSPALAEILYQIGAGDQLVGVSDYCLHPTEARALPKIGGLRVNLEAVHDLTPSHVLSQGRDPQLELYLREMNVTHERFRVETISDICEATQRLGLLTRRSPAAAKEVARLRSAFEAAARASRGRRPLRVLLSISRRAGSLERIMTCSGGFLNECLAAHGAVNVFADLSASYPSLSLEAVLDRDPDLIIELPGRVVEDATESALRADWERFRRRDGSARPCRVVRRGSALIPGPRVTVLLEDLARLLAPRAIEQATPGRGG